MKTQHFPLLVRNFPFLFYYRGDYKIDISSSIFEIVDANLSLNFERSFVSRLSYLVIECIQNVYRYTDSKGSFHDYCLIYSDRNYCHIMTRNLVSESKVDELRNRLEEIKTKTSGEIDEAYKNGLRSQTLTSKGAGLGLIEMARKTGNQLAYDLQKTGMAEWSYSLHIKLPLPVKEGKDFSGEKKSDGIIKTFLQEFEHNKNTLLYSGDFSNNFLNSILTLVTKQYKRDKELASSIFKYALIEFIQNVRRHASKSADGTIEALLSIEWLKDKMILTTSNFISDENAKKISELLDPLKKSLQITLANASEDKMNDENDRGGLGLIDIARLNWPRFIDYSIHSYENSEKSIDLSIKFDYDR